MPTRKLGLSALMKAIYTRLTTASETSAYSIYNYVPKGTAFPYIRIGESMGVRSGSFTTRDTEAEDNVVIVHIWSAALGDKECADMMNNIVQAVTSNSLSIAAYYAPMSAFLDYSDIIVDTSEAEEIVRHGIMRFRFQMSPS